MSGRHKVSFEEWAGTLPEEQRALAETIAALPGSLVRDLYGCAKVPEIFRRYGYEKTAQRFQRFDKLRSELLPGARVMNAGRRAAAAPGAAWAVILSEKGIGAYRVIDSDHEFDYWSACDCKPTGEIVNLEEFLHGMKA